MATDTNENKGCSFYKHLDEERKMSVGRQIVSQWDGLQEQFLANMNTAIGRLFLLNSGSAAALLAYLGTATGELHDVDSALPLATYLFIAGAVLVLFWHLVHQLGLGVIVNQYQQDVGEFYASRIPWDELNPKEPRWFTIGGWVLAVLSLLCLIFGVLISAKHFV